MRIICFPYAGGSADIYRSWVEWLPDSVELVGIQAPGRGTRLFETCYSEMQSLINELFKVFETLIDRPYILFGHSLGSKIAFELLVECSKRGLPLPKHFIASGSKGPHITSQKEAIHHLPDEDFISELRELNGTPNEVLENSELMELFLPTLRADFKLAESYIFTTSDITFSCPISIFGGKNDCEISSEDLLSWNDFFCKPADVHLFPGDHFFIETDNEIIAQKINMIVKKALSQLGHTEKIEVTA